MYDAWQEDPKSVHSSWDAYFRNVEAGAGPGQAFQAAPPVSIFPGLLPMQQAATSVAPARYFFNDFLKKLDHIFLYSKKSAVVSVFHHWQKGFRGKHLPTNV